MTGCNAYLDGLLAGGVIETRIGGLKWMQNGPQRPREVFFRPDDGGYPHSVLANREAMSAVPRNLAAVWGEHFRRPSANQVGKLCLIGVTLSPG